MTNLFAMGEAQANMLNDKLSGQATGAVGLEVGPNGQITAKTDASVDMVGAPGVMSADAWALYKSS